MEDRIKDHTSPLDMHKSMVPDGMHLRVLKELADAMRPLFIILKRSWQSAVAPSDWKKADSISIVKKDNPGNKPSQPHLSPWESCGTAY